MPSSPFRRRREGGDVCAIYVHAGAGFHSYANEENHLTACQEYENPSNPNFGRNLLIRDVEIRLQSLTSNSAATIAMGLLKNGGSALDAVEMAIKIFEDREITNAGYGSNLCMDGTVECDASIVDHYGRSGAAGAVSKVKNPIGLARMILDETTRPLSLQRVPPNLLVGQGATDYADEKGLLTVFNDYMVSKAAKERWKRWKKDLDQVDEQDKLDRAERLMRKSSFYSDQQLPNHKAFAPPSEISPPVSPLSYQGLSTLPHLGSADRPMVSSTTDISDTYFEAQTKIHARHVSLPASALSDPVRAAAMECNPNIDGNRPPAASEIATDDNHPWASKRRRLSVSTDGSLDKLHPPQGNVAAHATSKLHKARPHASMPSPQPGDGQGDRIIDTVGAIAVDCFGNIAAGSSSGGIGMKHRGRCGPAALVGIGTAVIPADPEDPDETSVATVTSGTGEHMATTLASATCASRIYSSVRKTRGELQACTEDQAMYSVIEREFMGHPGVKNSHCAGAIGIMAVKKTKHGIMLYFGHNTDSFALASMQTGDRKPSCVMSRSKGCGNIAQGGRVIKYRGNGYRP